MIGKCYSFLLVNGSLTRSRNRLRSSFGGENCMNFNHFFRLYADHMTGDDAVAATQSIQNGEACGVMIDSPGGTMNNFMDEAVALIDQKFTALGLTIGSLAVDYYLCASTRIALPSSTFSVHHPKLESCGEEGDQTLEQLLWKYEVSRALIETGQASERARKSHSELIRVILGTADCKYFGVRWVAKRTGLEPGIVEQLMRDEVTLTASEALQLGFVHHIIDA